MTRGLGGHSPANVSFHLKGIEMPANKQDLIEQAKQNGAKDDVLSVLERMPEDEYETMADVMKAYGRVDSNKPH